MRRVTATGACTLASVVLASALAGCAQSAPPLAAGASSSPQTTASSTPSASPAAATSASASAATGSASSARPSASGPPKQLATSTLPATLGAYRAASATGATGEQSVTYHGAATNDVIVVAIVPRGDVGSAVASMQGVGLRGQATCGTLASTAGVAAACALPLDRGYVLVNGGPGVQTVDQVAAFAAAVWAALP